MNNRNKSRSRSKFQGKQKSVDIQDYDLTQSFNKVRPYSKPAKKNTGIDGTCSDEEYPSYNNQKFF